MSKTNTTAAILCLLLLTVLPSLALAVAGNLAPEKVLALVEHMEDAYRRIEDYTTTIHWQFRQAGELEPASTVLMKFKKPFRIYVKWVDGQHKGRELLYDGLAKKDEMFVCNGLFTLCLDPEGFLAKGPRGHSVKELGLGYLISLVSENTRRAARRPQDKVVFKDLGTENIYGTKSRCVDALLPGPDHGYYGSRVSFCADTRTSLPTRVTIYNQDGDLLENFVYQNTRINTGLQAKDFDRKNPKYNF